MPQELPSCNYIRVRIIVGFVFVLLLSFRAQKRAMLNFFPSSMVIQGHKLVTTRNSKQQG